MFIFDVKVVPGSNHMRWELGHVADSLICHHKNPDDSKKTNTDIIDAIANALGVTHSKVHLVHGVESRDKRFKVSEVNASYQKLLTNLGLSK
jgi:uncharacterized protein YggU (UPF0235/DUF167 family)